jgi:hypothetical protein
MDLDALDDSVGTWLVTGLIPVVGAPASTITGAVVPTAAGTTTAQVTTAAVAPATPPGAQVAGNAQYAAVNPSGLFQLALFTNDDGTAARGTINVAQDIRCSAQRVLVGDRTYGFSVPILANGSFTANVKIGIAVMIVDGRVTGNGELRGTMRYIHTDTGCDTGLLPFVGSIRS